MKVWLFDQIFWPKPGNRLLYPYPGRLWEPSIGIEQYHGGSFVRLSCGIARFG